MKNNGSIETISGLPYNDTDCIVCFFVFSYNRTIHDQKEEGMREEAEFISALLEKQGDADVGFRRQPERQTFASPLIAENGMVLYDNKSQRCIGHGKSCKTAGNLKSQQERVKVPAAVFPVRSSRRLIIMQRKLFRRQISASFK